jgi:uncharacterized protein YggE
MPENNEPSQMDTQFSHEHDHCEHHGHHGCMHGFRRHGLMLHFIALLTVIAVFALGSAATYFYLQNKSAHTITVSGTATSTISNQVAQFSANVTSQDKDKTTAVSNANGRVAKVIAALKTFGIAENDLQTTNLNVYQQQEPYYDNGLQKYKLGDWIASNGLNITLRNVSKASDLATLLTTLDISDVSGPNMTVDTKQIDDAKIFAAAIANAQHKAAVMAAQAGKRLGSVISISEGSSYNNPQPIYNMALDKGIDGGGSVPVQPGSTDTTRSVVVTFVLK